jgi:hypothetical protein
MWASLSQDTGKAGNVSFNKNTIYPYHWWPMATFVNDKLVLFRNWSYSVRTTQHLNYTRHSIPSYYQIIEVYNPGENGYIPHEENVSHFVTDIALEFEKFKASRKYKGSILRKQTFIVDTLKRYCEAFSLEVPDFSKFDLDSPEFWKEAADQHAKVSLALQKKSEAQERANQERASIIEKHKPDLIKSENLWLDGATDKDAYNIPYIGVVSIFSETRIRIKGNEVQTSLGAFVPVESAKRLWNLMKAKSDIKGERVGAFTVLGLNGFLHVGCHNISVNEINRFVEKYGW